MTRTVGKCWLTAICVATLLEAFCGKATAQITSYLNVTALRASTTESKNQVILQGYNGAGDFGGGLLYNNGRNCVVVSQSLSWTAGVPTISTSTTGGMYVGDAVAYGQGLAGIPDYDQIVAIVPNTSFTLAQAPVIGGSSSTFKTSCDNNGTVFSTTGGVPVSLQPQAYARASSNFSQTEWGAFNAPGDTTTDRSTNLQFWLDAPQPHIALPGSVYISLPLVCPPGGSIQGAPTTAVAENSAILPAFTIVATSFAPATIFGTLYSAMLTMPPNVACGLHRVGLIANSPTTGNIYDTVDAMGTSDLIDDHSYFSGGFINVNSGGGSGSANLEIYDSSLNNSVSTNALIFSPNAKLIRNNFSGAGTGISSSTVSTAVSPADTIIYLTSTKGF